MSAEINIGDQVETIDGRTHKAVMRRVVGFLRGPRGGVLKVLYVVNNLIPAQTTTPKIWSLWLDEARARRGVSTNERSGPGRTGAKLQPAYLRMKPVAVQGEPEPPAFTETKDLLTIAVQRICGNTACRKVFRTRVVTVRDCPACTEKARAEQERLRRQAALREARAAAGGGE